MKAKSVQKTTKPATKSKAVSKPKPVSKAKLASKAKPAKKPEAASKPKPASKRKLSNELVQMIVRVLDDKKAENLRVLDVSDLSSITDYLVLATGNSEPHLRALRIEVERVLDEQKAKILGVDTTRSSGWTVVDAFEVMVHIFTPENRDKYQMELLWKDAVELELPVS
jgi:ribosome-associated protein